MPDLVLFDLDNTLLEGDSDFEWGEFLCDQKLVDPQQYRQRNRAFYEQYLAREIDIVEYLKFSLQPLTRYPLQTLQELRQQFIKERIYPLIPVHNQALVQEHQHRGDTTVLITATQQFITQPIADIFAMDDLIATKPEMIDGRFSGNIVGLPCFGNSKLKRFTAWLKSKQCTQQHSWFYSDSYNDLPLLEFVDEPVVKNGDADLLSIAQKRNWTIWQKPEKTNFLIG